MAIIVLISCVSRKLNHKAKASDLYQSPLFKYALRYAKLLKADHINILSAKYNLLKLDDIIEPYDETLNIMKDAQIWEWSQKVIEQLEDSYDMDNDEFIFLAGERYRKYLIRKMKKYSVPMKGLGIGKQLYFLKKNTKDKHKLNDKN